MMHFDNRCCWSVSDFDSMSFFCLERTRIHALSIAREVYIAPSRFVFRMFEMCSGDVRGSMFEADIPAAFMRMSTFVYDQISMKQSEGAWENHHSFLKFTHPFTRNRNIADQNLYFRV